MRVFCLFWFDLGPFSRTALDHARTQESAQNQERAAGSIDAEKSVFRSSTSPVARFGSTGGLLQDARHVLQPPGGAASRSERPLVQRHRDSPHGVAAMA